MSIRVNEIFGPTIQGEGALIGQPTLFVRTGGCDYRCTWCDTLHAVDSKYRDEWKPMSAEDIFARVQELSKNTPIMVSLSGGNPAIHDLGPLITLGKAKKYTFNLETQGSIAQAWFKDLDMLTLSPKPPSSNMATDWAKFDECLRAAGNGPQIVMKIVVFDDEDYAYAKDAAARYPHLQLYLQPGNHTPPPQALDIAGITQRLTWLGEKVANDAFNARVLPQLHVLMWGNARGV